jgi:CheY-like chemotaxis protein
MAANPTHKILVIDDEVAIVEMIRNFLEMCG